MMMFDLSPINQHFGQKEYEMQLSQLAFNRVPSSAIMPSLSLVIHPNLDQFSIVDQSTSLLITIDERGIITSNNLNNSAGFIVQGKINHPKAIHHIVRQFIATLHDDHIRSDQQWFELFIRQCNLNPNAKDTGLDALFSISDDQLAPLKQFIIEHPIAANLLMALPIGALLYVSHILTATTALLSVFSINALNEHLSNEAEKLQPSLGEQIAGAQRDEAIQRHTGFSDLKEETPGPDTTIACR